MPQTSVFFSLQTVLPFIGGKKMAITFPTTGSGQAIMKVTMKINAPTNCGWTETYWLAGNPTSTTPPNPFTNIAGYAKNGAILRAYMLGLGCSIVSVVVTNPQAPRLSVQAITTPQAALLVDSESTVAPIEDPEVTYLYRCDDGFGHHEERQFRGLRASWVSNNQPAGTPIAGGYSAFNSAGTLPSTIPLGSAPAGNQAILNFLYWMQTYCVIHNTPVGSPRTFTTYPMATINFRAVSSHKVGRPFGLPHGRALTKV
jgi:hypothetical protein